MNTAHDEKLQELRKLAGQVEEYRIQFGWSKAKLCSEFAGLGSPKTYSRVTDPTDDLREGLALERQITNYTAALELIATHKAKARPPELVYSDFRNIIAVKAAVAEATREEQINRFVCVQGPNGTGKDACINELTTAWPRLCTSAEAHELWRDSHQQPAVTIMYGDLLRALHPVRHGEEDQPFQMPKHSGARFELIIEELRQFKRILLINEAHHLGPRGLNTLRTIINKTPTVVAIFCIPTLMDRLVSSAYEEAIQLFGNRLGRMVTLETPGSDEIKEFFTRRGVKWEMTGAENSACKTIAQQAPAFGNWRFVNRLARAFLDHGKPICMDQYIRILTATRNTLYRQPNRRS